MNLSEIDVGFNPAGAGGPPHFFIANTKRRICTTPIGGFDDMEPNELGEALPEPAAHCWRELMGEDAPADIVASIVMAWMHCYVHYLASLTHKPPTVH